MLLLSLLLISCGEKETEEEVVAEDSATEEESQVATWEDITPILEDYYDPSIMPALGAARISNGELTEAGTIGLRSIDADAEVTDWDKWHLGSCTKAMTGNLVGILVDEGILHWDATMEELFPEIEIHPDYQDVTVKMMLSHSGGTWSSLVDHPSTWNEMVAGGDLKEIRSKVVQDVLTEAPEVTPGTQYLYSNTGYIVIGAALEKITGSTWEEIMQEKIFTPLEMDSCGFGPQDVGGHLEHPWSHYNLTAIDPDSGNADNPAALGPAGTVHCNLPDWSKFIIEQLKLYRGEGTLLSQPQAEQLFEPQLQEYAMGWSIASRSWAGGDVFVHSGSNVKNLAIVWAAPELDEAYLTVTNTGSESAYQVLDQVTGELIQLED